ncbi:LysR family transcriptional regulator [Ciceribacter sp. RN22]|uniref:LysR family transcriptional regulator n=1 Tax=Ciceribacter sp. RN22 TaxID=2954932 RepID=UPI0020920264|nr:LysR family transcriptional regulator [Ciceribacter sp. RN22]MCO6181015.1 LysR family transcriptional regulator [Ciceribacter sp. RN22]
MGRYESLERLSLGTIRCVREVLACQSVSGAAERLGITQPAVSQQVARFEKLSGIPIITRNGNNFVVRSDAVAGLIATIVEAENTLRNIARGESRTKPRLGICDYIAAQYCYAIEQYTQLSRDFDIHVGRPASLIEMFNRGEIDVVVRGLFHHESATELMTEVPLVWVGACKPWTDQGSDPNEPLPVILETNQSPYAYYGERLLQEARTPYRVVARIDDHLVRSHFVAACLACTAIPKFLMRSLPAQTVKLPRIPNVAHVRFGLFYNKKSMPYKGAERIFDNLAAQISV